MYIFAHIVLDLFDETLKIFKERKFIKSELILPTYICSIGCHMFNFMNKHKKIYYDGDIIPDMRLHIFYVTIPGFGKTLLINQFMSKYNGLLQDTDIHVSKIGSMTSSGFVGSIKTTQDGNTIVNKGILQKKADFILGSDEFSNIIMSSKTAHSGNLINDLLSALDDGQMHKDQAGGGMEYETFATVWGATQPGRFELKSGLARRFSFVIYMPDVEDVKSFRRIRRESKNVRLDVKRILQYKVAINERFREIKENLKRIEFDDSYYDWIESRFSMHYEDILFERTLLGYWLMKVDKIPEVLVLKLNDEIKDIINRQIHDRLKVQKGVDNIKIMDVLKNIKEIEYVDLLKLLLSFAIPEKYINTNLDALAANKIIKIENGIVTNFKYRGE